MIDYNKYLNKHIREIGLSPIEKISLMAAEVKDCIVLGVGEPDFRTPWRIREAGIQALEKGKTWYSPGLGLLPLKKRYAIISAAVSNWTIARKKLWSQLVAVKASI